MNHSRDGYVFPKRPYSFEALLAHILELSYEMLVEGGRLSFWMPTANDEDQELAVPQHEGLVLVSNCIQPFNKCESPSLLHSFANSPLGSRRLLTYRRRPGKFEAKPDKSHNDLGPTARAGVYADDLNNFRKRVSPSRAISTNDLMTYWQYFQGFKVHTGSESQTSEIQNGAAGKT